MVEPEDERLSGDMPVPMGQLRQEEPPLVSHEVIASYAADAARTVPGIVEMHASHWKKLSSRVRETHSGGVVVKDSPLGGVEVEIHARVAWGTVIPELADQVEIAVRSRMTALLSLDLDAVTLFVDEIALPPREVARAAKIAPRCDGRQGRPRAPAAPGALLQRGAPRQGSSSRLLLKAGLPHQGRRDDEVGRRAVARHGDVVDHRDAQQGLDVHIVGMRLQRIPEEHHQIDVAFHDLGPDLLVTAQRTTPELLHRQAQLPLQEAARGAGGHQVVLAERIQVEAAPIHQVRLLVVVGDERDGLGQRVSARVNSVVAGVVGMALLRHSYPCG